MPKDTPFDVWNGEDLATAEVILSDSAEEVAMHLEEDEGPAATWSAPHAPACSPCRRSLSGCGGG